MSSLVITAEDDCMGIGNLRNTHRDKRESSPAPSSPLLRSPRANIPDVIVDEISPPANEPVVESEQATTTEVVETTDLLMEDVLPTERDDASVSSKESTVVAANSTSEMIK